MKANRKLDTIEISHTSKTKDRGILTIINDIENPRTLYLEIIANMFGKPRDLGLTSLDLYERIRTDMFLRLSKHSRFYNYISKEDNSKSKDEISSIYRIYEFSYDGLYSKVALGWETTYDVNKSELLPCYEEIMKHESSKIDFNLLGKGNAIKRNEFIMFRGPMLDKPCNFFTIAEQWLYGFGFK